MDLQAQVRWGDMCPGSLQCWLRLAIQPLTLSSSFPPSFSFPTFPPRSLCKDASQAGDLIRQGGDRCCTGRACPGCQGRHPELVTL